MARFPYYGFPFQYPYYKYYNQNKHINYNNNYTNSPNSKLNETSPTATNAIKKENTEEKSSSVKSNRSYSIPNLPFSFNFNGLSNTNNSIINILGLELYLDDIIILCILFILYKEEIKDEILFIALILLLLT